MIVVHSRLLAPSPWNPRVVMKDDFARLMHTIQADPNFLESRPVLARMEHRDDDGPYEIYAGSQRYHALCRLYRQGWTSPWGQDMIPACLDMVSVPEAKRRAILDNHHAGHWQEIELAEILQEIGQANLDLASTGFSDTEIVNALAASGITDAVHPISGTRITDRPISTKADGSPLSIILSFPNRASLEDARWRLSPDRLDDLGASSLEVYDEDGKRLPYRTE